MPVSNRSGNTGLWPFLGLTTNPVGVQPSQSNRFLLPEALSNSAEAMMDDKLSSSSTSSLSFLSSQDTSGYSKDLLTSTLSTLANRTPHLPGVDAYTLYELCRQHKQQQHQAGLLLDLSNSSAFLDDAGFSAELCAPNLFLANETNVIGQDDGEYLSPNMRVVLIIFLTLMIVMTVVGNILVCLSVILVRKLRHPSNYLLVSLAISDLCVAILVMPLALQYELTNSWNLSAAICDLWVSFDVTCCTSSILNLCTISIDRYLAITRPLTYGVRRSTKKMLSFIAGVWIASCLISIPPVLLLGNEHGTSFDPKCEVSQNMGYQLYATLAAFYIPLVVMIVMYLKIYGAAKNVCDAEWKDQRFTSYPKTVGDENDGNAALIKYSRKGKKIKGAGGLSYHKGRPQPQATVSAPAQFGDHHHSNHHHHRHNVRSETASLGSHVNNNDSMDKDGLETEMDSGKSAARTRDNVSRSSQQTNAGASSVENSSEGEPITCCRARLSDANNNREEKRSHRDKSKKKKKPSGKVKKCDDREIGLTVMKHERVNGMTARAGAAKVSPSQSCSSCCCANQDDVNVVTSAKSSKKCGPPTSESSFKSMCSLKENRQSIMNSFNRLSRRNRKQANNAINPQMSFKRAQNVLRERKASITLGIIMTAFTVCWLPFFIMALIRPFTGQFFEIPRALHSTALWLGYANSMLNPIIYVTFHQDFRRAFKYLLCLQCSTMGSRLRAEAYLSQYGKSHQSSVSSATGGVSSAGGLYRSTANRGTFPKANNHNRATLDVTSSASTPLQQPLLGTSPLGEKASGTQLNIALVTKATVILSTTTSQAHFSSSDSSSGLSQNEIDALQQSLNTQLTPKVESRLHFGSVQENQNLELEDNQETSTTQSADESMTTNYVLRGEHLESIQLSTGHPFVNLHTKLIYTSSNINSISSLNSSSGYEIVVPEGSGSIVPEIDNGRSVTQVTLPSPATTRVATSTASSLFH